MPNGYRILKKSIPYLKDESKSHMTAGKNTRLTISLMKQFKDLNVAEPGSKMYKPVLIANLDMVLNELVENRKNP